MVVILAAVVFGTCTAVNLYGIITAHKNNDKRD